MTIPPPESAAPRRGRHARRAPGRAGGVTQIVPSSELPAGVNALASADGKTIIIRTGLDKAARRNAVREVLAATHRFPALALYPALADARIRRLLADLADGMSGFGQHAAGLLAPDSPIAAIVATVAVVAAGVGVSVGVVTGAIPSAPLPGRPAAGSASAAPPVHRVVAHLPQYPASYLGVYEAGTPGSYAPVTEFAVAIEHTPNLALYYSGWGEPFRLSFADAAAANGATPVVQLDPGQRTRLAGIVAGQYDKYLLTYARAVNAFGKNVVIGFGHEVNADWYPWGWQHQDPKLFVQAWQHIVNLFRGQGDDNVTWMWTINVSAPGRTGPVGDWWPGSAYVTWVGIDGYYLSPTGTFGSVFGPTLAEVHAVAPGKPILISETASDPRQRREAAQITGLFAGIRRRQILGFIWFDQPGRTGEDWRLEGNRAAIRAFRRAARGYR